jgi:hypothetical protein
MVRKAAFASASVKFIYDFKGKAGGQRLSEKIGNSSVKHCEMVI